MKSVYLTGTSGLSDQAVCDTLNDFILQWINNFEWHLLQDIVLLKSPLNSEDPYPVTAHHLALEVTSRPLAGCGVIVVIGDQSGIRHVLPYPGWCNQGET
ncbi:MAG: hypothetical protein NTV68_10395 [Methanomicrobiales archaeon]|nr:hypothetical protein [Methanomicrobiales archaeon]